MNLCPFVYNRLAIYISLALYIFVLYMKAHLRLFEYVFIQLV